MCSRGGTGVMGRGGESYIQCHLALGWPGTWSDVALGASARVFLACQSLH